MKTRHYSFFKKISLPFLLSCLLLGFSSCEKGLIPEYNLPDVNATQSTANKGKLKTPEQYVAILHVNLYNIPMSSNDIYRLSTVIRSIGDKEIAQEMILSNFMNDADPLSYAAQKGYEVVKPTNEAMRANLPSFITQTYERFYLRSPTQSEIEWWKQYIATYPNVTPEMVYFAFAISNEYQYY